MIFLCGIGMSAQTVIPSASTTGVVVGAGYVKSTDRQVIRTPGNKVYIAVVDDSGCLATSGITQAVIRMYKGSGTQTLSSNVPSSFSEVDAAHHPTATGSGNSCQFNPTTSLIQAPDCRLSGTTIMCAYIKPTSPATGSTTGSLFFRTFETTTDLWGTETTLTTGANVCGGGGWPRWSNVALTLDASDNPWIIYSTAGTCGTAFTNQINWLARTASGGTAWTTPTVITGSSGTEVLYAAMVTALNGTIHAVWENNSITAAHANVLYAKFSGSWGAVETVASSTLSANDDDGTENISIDPSGLPHVAYMVGTGQNGVPCTSGCDNYERERYRTSGGVWTDNSPPATSGGSPSSTGTWPTGGVGHSPSIYIAANGTIFDFLGHDTNKTPAPFEYQSALGGPWTAQINVDPCNATTSPSGEPGCDGAVSIRYDPLRDNNNTLIDFAYYKEDDGTAGFNHHGTIWYKAIAIAAPGGDLANLWIDTAGTGSCTRSPIPVPYNTLQACASPSAAWTASVGGDTIVAKGGIYATQSFSASGTKTSLVTIKAASGESPWFTQNGSISGVSNMLVYDDRPPNIEAETGIGNGLTMGLTNVSGTNITFDGIDLYCQDNSPWPQVSGASGFGSACSARIGLFGVDGFTMRNGSVGPETDCVQTPCNAQNVNTIGNCGGTTNAGCNNINFDHVLFHDVRLLDNPAIAHTSMWIIFRGQNLTFTSNRFIRCTGCNSANVFFGQEGTTNTPDLLTFIGNEIDSASGCGAWCMGYRSPATAPTVTMKYNTIVGPATLSTSAPAPMSGPIPYTATTWTGNIITYAPAFDSGRCNAISNDHNVFGSPDAGTPAMSCGTANIAATNMNQSVYFANPAVLNYQLKAGSPAIRAGGSGCAGLVDINGNTRPLPGNSCDIGSFQFGNSTPLPVPATNLFANVSKLLILNRKVQ